MFGLEKIFNKPPTKTKFADLAAERLRQDLPHLSFTYDEGQFCLRGDNGQTLYLTNFYEDFLKSDKAARADLMSRLAKVAEVPAIPTDFADARDKLLPVLRYLPGLELTVLDAMDCGLAEADTWNMRPFGSILGIGVAFDTETVVQQVGTTVLFDWGISAHEALAIATDNLRHKAPPAFLQAIPGTYVSQYGDLYDAARILLPELAWQLELNGNPVAMVPTRECLLITGDKDEAGLAFLMALAKDRMEQTSRHLSPEMFRLEGSEWTSWQPEGSNLNVLRTMRLSHRSGDYDAQKEALCRLFEKKGNDVFVASFQAVKSASGEVLTYSTLSFRLPTVLPQSELVALVDPEAVGKDSNHQPFVVKWETLAEELGADLVKLPYVLPRYSVLFDPTPDQIARLRLKAVSFS